MSPKQSQLEANVVCPEKLIPGLKTTGAFKDTEKMKDLNKYFPRKASVSGRVSKLQTQQKH